jgi:hypothetical protein
MPLKKGVIMQVRRTTVSFGRGDETTCQSAWEYTLRDTNSEFLEALKANLDRLGPSYTQEEMSSCVTSIIHSHTHADLIAPVGDHYQFSFTSTRGEEAVKKLISSVYTKYLQSKVPLTYPFDAEVVHTVDPKSLTREDTSHLTVAPDHPLRKAERKMAISTGFFQKVQDGSIKAYQEVTQDRPNGTFIVYKMNHRGYQIDAEGNIDEYNSDNESSSTAQP